MKDLSKFGWFLSMRFAQADFSCQSRYTAIESPTLFRNLRRNRNIAPTGLKSIPAGGSAT
jgi:hypothetical protein